MRRSVALLAALGLSAALVRAGEWDTEGTDFSKACSTLFSPSWLTETASCGAFLFHNGKPVRMMIPQSVVPGGGTAIGATYIQPLSPKNSADSNLTFEAGSSLRQFWFANAVLTFNHRIADKNARIHGYAHALGLPLMPFYGIGPNTARSSLVDFSERQVRTGGDLSVQLTDWLNVGAAAEYLAPRISGVTGGTVRSITTSFNEATAPGLAHQPGFVHTSLFAEPAHTWTRFQTYSRVGWEAFHDTDSGHYSFQRFEAGVLETFYPEVFREKSNGGRTTITRPKKSSVLYIYGRVVSDHAGTGSVVPFYLLDTIGGSDINSIASLRGFQDYRFRGPDLFYLQTQWERRLLPDAKSGSSTLRKVAGAVGILGFYDAGQVALKASDFSFSSMRQSFGFGLTFWSGDKVWFRAFIGLGSGEGSHTFFGVTDPSAEKTHL
jgi:hypothetical protein